ncbi:hypothetical protein LCGC14_0616530 [marine sediment metagenome]|uniref:DUF6794 domain-containing protein n=1 Tax=marine sediment metagenome TaxID=412755 RepID=A0A0F9R640_9ZZZZ
MPTAKKELPRTVEEAVDRLLSLISEEDKQSLKNTPEKDLIMFHFGLGEYIRNEFGFWQGNSELLKSREKESNFVHPDDSSSIIIEALWKKLCSS